MASRLLKTVQRINGIRGWKWQFLVKVFGWLAILGLCLVFEQMPVGAAVSPLLVSPPSTNQISGAQVTAGWVASPDTNVVGYYLCWGLASGQSTNLIDVGNVTNATLGGLTTNVWYYFTVVAYDAFGDQAVPSNEIQYMATNQASSGPPTILADLTSQNVTEGLNVSFQVSVSGTGPFSYQWFFNGAVLAGATSNVLTLSNVTSSQAGSYQVVVSSALGKVTSSSASLDVLQASLLRIAAAGNGAYSLSFGGAPNQTYSIQHSTNLNSAWQVLATATTDSSGVFTYLVTPNTAQGCFRVAGP